VRTNTKKQIRPSNPAVRQLICQACGTAARRRTARFCAVCGKLLFLEYQPMDALFSSYHLQRGHFAANTAPPVEKNKTQSLFKKDENSAATTAMAFVVYSLVPFLGILFSPGALIMGGVGLFVSYQKPALGGRQTSANSIFLGLVIATIQLLLWWLLYLIPELKRF
jgi:hypothetical protein